MNIAALTANLHVILPEMVLAAFALLVILADMLRSDEEESRLLPLLTLAGILAAMAASAWIWNRPPVSYQESAVSDGFALGARLVILVAAGLATLLSMGYLPRINRQMGEYYALILLATLGMTMMASATDLIVLFLALEIFSLALYILSGYYRQNPRSTEASMKYFLLGAFASSFFVYGAALLYGATGATQLREIGNLLASDHGNPNLLWPGIALLLAGFGFKVSLVPFHMWTPDVYQGAPTPVTAFMSAGTKTAAFAAFVRVLVEALPAQQLQWSWALAVLAVLTMTVGNLSALRQLSLKRMLAYSSVAHAGYILVALVPGTAQGSKAALFYLLTYAFMNVGALAVVITLEKLDALDALQSRAAGLADRWPLLALAMSIFMLSLSGIPPLAGFFGKFFVFQAAVEGGWTWLAVVGVINSAISAYYYLRVIVAMYFHTAQEPVQARRWGGLGLSLALTALATVIIGLYPSLWIGLLAGLGG